MTLTFKGIQNGLEMSQSSGGAYTAQFDGRKYPYNGDPPSNNVSLRWISSHHVVQTQMHDEQVTIVIDMTVSSDGRTLTMVGNPSQGPPMTIVAARR